MHLDSGLAGKGTKTGYTGNGSDRRSRERARWTISAPDGNLFTVNARCLFGILVTFALMLPASIELNFCIPACPAMRSGWSSATISQAVVWDAGYSRHENREAPAAESREEHQQLIRFRSAGLLLPQLTAGPWICWNSTEPMAEAGTSTPNTYRSPPDYC